MQVCTHTDQVQEVEEVEDLSGHHLESSGKLQLLDRLLQRLMYAGKRALLLSVMPKVRSPSPCSIIFWQALLLSVKTPCKIPSKILNLCQQACPAPARHAQGEVRIMSICSMGSLQLLPSCQPQAEWEHPPYTIQSRPPWLTVAEGSVNLLVLVLVTLLQHDQNSTGSTI